MNSIRLRPLWVVYLLFGGLLLVLVVSAMRETLANAPSRDAVAKLEPYGLVTVRFSTDPNPPLLSGTVGLSFALSDRQRRPVPIDWARFEYGMQGSDPLYHRYSPDQQIPVYRKDKWYNFLPEGHRYHWGHHFVLDMM